jgi:hypothetical protein
MRRYDSQFFSAFCSFTILKYFKYTFPNNDYYLIHHFRRKKLVHKIFLQPFPKCLSVVCLPEEIHRDDFQLQFFLFNWRNEYHLRRLYKVENCKVLMSHNNLWRWRASPNFDPFLCNLYKLSFYKWISQTIFCHINTGMQTRTPYVN